MNPIANHQLNPFVDEPAKFSDIIVQEDSRGMSPKLEIIFLEKIAISIRNAALFHDAIWYKPEVGEARLPIFQKVFYLTFIFLCLAIYVYFCYPI